MVNIIVGLIAIVLGIWGMVANWWATIDMISTLLPMVLAVYGAIAVVAGIKRFSSKPVQQVNEDKESDLG